MTPSTVSDHLTCPNEAAATGAGVISENLRVQRVLRRYPPVNIQKTIENGHLYLIYPLKMMIFNSYVSLPEGMGQYYKQLLAFNMLKNSSGTYVSTSVFLIIFPNSQRGLKIEDDWNHQPECVGGVGITHCPKDWSDWSSCDPFFSHNQPDKLPIIETCSSARPQQSKKMFWFDTKSMVLEGWGCFDMFEIYGL